MEEEPEDSTSMTLTGIAGREDGWIPARTEGHHYRYILVLLELINEAQTSLIGEVYALFSNKGIIK